MVEMQLPTTTIATPIKVIIVIMAAILMVIFLGVMMMNMEVKVRRSNRHM